jgi:hypothetical protein
VLAAADLKRTFTSAVPMTFAFPFRPALRATAISASAQMQWAVLTKKIDVETHAFKDFKKSHGMRHRFELCLTPF